MKTIEDRPEANRIHASDVGTTPHPLATELNGTIQGGNLRVYEMLSQLGRELYFPKGILSQAAEAKKKATRFNATIGIAKENGKAMHLPSIMGHFSDLEPNDALPYAPTGGNPELRTKWQQEIVRKNPGLDGMSTSLPVVTSGITHGLSLVSDLFVDPGDVVLLPAKVWGNYIMTFGVRRGARFGEYPLFSAAGSFDVEGFRQALIQYRNQSKVIVILNFPNNPTGYSVTEDEGKAICAVLAEVASTGTNVVAVCDDAYFGLFYEDEVLKESLFSYLADADERILAVKLDGATKEDYVWGFRVGFVTFAAARGDEVLYTALEKKVGGAIRGAISNCPCSSQTIVLRALQSPGYLDEKQAKFEILKARASKVKEVLRNEQFADVWSPYPFNAGYFMCIKLKVLLAEEFRVRLLDGYGIGVIATGKHDIRIAFSCIEEDDIPELFDSMYSCAKELQVGLV
jgi:aspartate/methionine/tyrosine aminotransferase